MDYSKLELLIQQYKLLAQQKFDAIKYTYYSITYHSTSLEGSTLTESQVIDLLEFNKTASNKPYEHHQMVYDHYEALLFLQQSVKNRISITPTFIKEVNALVMKSTGTKINVIMGTFDSSRGDYRLCGVQAGNHHFPDYKKVPESVVKICNEVNNNLTHSDNILQQCELAFKIHFDLVSIHPFADGNGRTSRLLMNYLLEYFNLPPLYISKNHKISYIKALTKARSKENLKHFFSFMFREYESFLKTEIRQLLKA